MQFIVGMGILVIGLLIGPLVWWFISAATSSAIGTRSPWAVRVIAFLSLLLTIHLLLLVTGKSQFGLAFLIASIISIFGSLWYKSPAQRDREREQSVTVATSEVHSVAANKPVPTRPQLILESPNTCPHCLQPGITNFARGSAAGSRFPRVWCRLCKSDFRLEISTGQWFGYRLVQVAFAVAGFGLCVAITWPLIEGYALIAGLAGAIAGICLSFSIIGNTAVGNLRPVSNSFIDDDNQIRHPWSEGLPDNVIEGRCQLSDRWSAVLPGKFTYRNIGKKVEVSRPGLVVCFEFRRAINQTAQSLFAQLRNSIPGEASNVLENTTHSPLRLSYRYNVIQDDTKVLPFHGYAVGESGYIYLYASFDDDAEVGFSILILDSLFESKGASKHSQKPL